VEEVATRTGRMHESIICDAMHTKHYTYTYHKDKEKTFTFIYYCPIIDPIENGESRNDNKQ